MSKATIVIPNINGKGWLKDSIESIYAQTEQDFDLIVVDNGSCLLYTSPSPRDA